MRNYQTCQMTRKRTPKVVHAALYLMDVYRSKQLFENTLAIGSYSISRFCCCEVDIDFVCTIMAENNQLYRHSDKTPNVPQLYGCVAIHGSILILRIKADMKIFCRMISPYFLRCQR